MCEESRQGIVNTPCSICVVENCEIKKKYPKNHGCDFGKVSNEMIKWAFEFTNHLRGTDAVISIVGADIQNGKIELQMNIIGKP